MSARYPLVTSRSGDGMGMVAFFQVWDFCWREKVVSNVTNHVLHVLCSSFLVSCDSVDDSRLFFSFLAKTEKNKKK